MLLNVENDDYGEVRHEVDCTCRIAALGARTRIAQVRGISKVVAAGISLDGETFDRMVEIELPARLGGGAGDFQFVEREAPTGTTVTLKRAGGPRRQRRPLPRGRQRTAPHPDNGVLAAAVWERGGGLRIDRSPPIITRAGKTLSYERLAPPAAPNPEIATREP